MSKFFKSVEHKLLGERALGFLLLVLAASYAIWETWDAVMDFDQLQEELAGEMGDSADLQRRFAEDSLPGRTISSGVRTLRTGVSTCLNSRKPKPVWKRTSRNWMDSSPTQTYQRPWLP